MSLEDFMLPCLNKKMFGVDCFGCGAQRSFFLLLEGRFAEAYQLFPAIYTIVLFFLFLLVSFLDKKRNYSVILIVLAVLNAVVIVVSYFFRNSHIFN